MNAQTPISRMNQSTPAEETGNIPLPVPFLNGNAGQAMASSDGEGEESETRASLSSHAACRAYADTVHELANAMTAVLINAQVLEWKLPPYSRMKRPVREIERHSQRGGALLKRLLRHFEADEAKEANQELCGQVSSLHGTVAAVTNQGPNASAGGPENCRPRHRSPVPPFLPRRNSHRYVILVLACFSRKRNHSHEYRSPNKTGPAPRLRCRRRDAPRAYGRCNCG